MEEVLDYDLTMITLDEDGYGNGALCMASAGHCFYTFWEAGLSAVGISGQSAT